MINWDARLGRRSTRAILAISAQPAEPGFDASATCHYCGRDSLSWHGFARAIFEEAARHGRTVPRLVPIREPRCLPQRPRGPAYSVLSTDKLAATLGIKPRPLRDSLRECMNELLGQNSSDTAMPQ